jgi:hypothetical protein
MVSQLHQLMLELIPGGAKKDLSATQAKALVANASRQVIWPHWRHESWLQRPGGVEGRGVIIGGADRLVDLDAVAAELTRRLSAPGHRQRM